MKTEINRRQRNSLRIRIPYHELLHFNQTPKLFYMNQQSKWKFQFTPQQYIRESTFIIMNISRYTNYKLVIK